MSGNINTKNITSENITVTNLTVTNINGRPYTGSGGGCGGYYTACPSCDDQPGEEPCMECGTGEVDPCDCFVDCRGPQGATGAQGATGIQGPQGAAQPNFYTNYTITEITSALGGTTFNIPSLTTDPNYYNVYQVDTTVGPLTINLPLISSLDNSQKRIHYIVDSAGELSNNNLIITPTPPNTIGGESSATIVVDYSSVQIMSNTTDKWLII